MRGEPLAYNSSLKQQSWHGTPFHDREKVKSTAKIHRTKRDGEEFGCATGHADSLDHQVEEFIGDVDLFDDALAVGVASDGRVGESQRDNIGLGYACGNR